MKIEDEIVELIRKIESSFSRQPMSYQPYINHIRFPKYKALVKDTRINFDFPVTVLVGKNGCNKTSILQALYGAPHGTSVGEYWFSTNVDKIEEAKKSIDRHCFVYGYMPDKVDKVVEVLKTRIKKSGDPDYWEPARPKKQYGMEPANKKELKKANNRAMTRWDPIRKNIVYCDCKEYVSAYDLFFYHFDFQKTDTQQKKQDFIRQRSTKLADVIASGAESYSYYGTERVEKNEIVSDTVCKIISNIMGEEYSEIRIITHSFYTKSGGNKASKTIWMKKNTQEYSEAFAGTGESRVILLVNDIYHAKEKSLILIDEPEISLHPSAIYGLKKFLLEQTLKKKHQMVITTHSTHIVKGFPKKAIKLMAIKNDEVDIIEDIEYQEAFYGLGEQIDAEKTIFVEDKLTKWIVDHVIEKCGSQHIRDNVSVEFLPGGASTIINKNIVNSSLQHQKDTYYLLDGDQYHSIEEIERDILPIEWIDEKTRKIDVDLIPKGHYNKLQPLIDKLSGNRIKFNPSGSGGKVNEDELIQMKFDFLKYWNTNVLFLPMATPEIGLIEIVDPGYDFSNDENGKLYFVDKAKRALDKEEVSSEDIFYEQKRCVGCMDKENDLYKCITELLNKISFE